MQKPSRPPRHLIAAWTLSLVAMAIVAAQDAHYVAEFPNLHTSQWYGFFHQFDPLVRFEYANHPNRQILSPQWIRIYGRLRMAGLGYLTTLLLAAGLALTSLLWYPARRLRSAFLLIGSMAPLAGLLGFGLAVPVASIHGSLDVVVKPTLTTMIAAIAWLVTLIVSVREMRRNPAPSIDTVF